MIYCKICLQPDTRPGTKFSQGLCPACDFIKNSTEFDWKNRFETLYKVVQQKKSINHKSGYDSILGISGGKDSTRLALWARDALNLNPLLVCVSYPPEQLTKTGSKNLNNLLELGFDLQLISPSPKTWKKLMRAAFVEFGNWAKSTELALFSGVPQIAVEMGISLILWGENPGLQLGALETLGKEGWDGNSLRNMNTLSGMNYEWLTSQQIRSDLKNSYIYPSLEVFESKNLQIVFLGWAMSNWGLLENGVLATLSGLQSRQDTALNTSDLIGLSSLDEDWVILNQMIKYYKYGFGRATDYVNEWIRQGRITREAGIEIVNKFDGACNDKYIDSFCEFIQISKNQFWEVVNKFVNKELFEVRLNSRPKKKFVIT